MTAKEFKVATVMAKETSVSLPWELHEALIGCGCSDFNPVCVSLKAVASLLRYQCMCLNGSWDEEEYQNMRAICVGVKSKVTVSDYVSDAEARDMIHHIMQRVLVGE